VRAPIVHLYLGYQRVDDRLPAYLSLPAEPLQAWRAQDFRFLDCRISMQGPQPEKVPLKNTWEPINAVLEHMTGISVRHGRKSSDRTDGYVGQVAADLIAQSRSHPGSRALTDPGTPPISSPWVHEIINCPSHESSCRIRFLRTSDRLADAIAESIVTAAVRRSRCMVESKWPSTRLRLRRRPDCRGWQQVEIEQIVRNVYRAAGYGGSWKPEPGNPGHDRRLSGKNC